MPPFDSSRLRVGKLPADVLARCLAKIPRDERVVLGPALGEDVAAITFGDRLLLAKTDPITFASDLIGWYAVNVNANDIATAGARPAWFMASALLPEGSSEAQAEALFDQILSACDALGCKLVGGHTEITYGLARPIVVGCMLGELAPDRLITTAGAQVGDEIIMAKPIAIEGTALLAREAPERLRAAGVSSDLITRCRDLLFDPGISVVKEALAAASAARVHSMHDPTEGGLATALREVATAAGVGVEIEAERLLILDETREICARLRLDPLGLIASGSLLITAAPSDSSRVVEAVRAAGSPAGVIGRVVSASAGLRIVVEGKARDLPEFPRDELARLLESG
jgi:hydrogenase maturation factor